MRGWSALCALLLVAGCPGDDPDVSDTGEAEGTAATSAVATESSATSATATTATTQTSNTNASSTGPTDPSSGQDASSGGSGDTGTPDTTAETGVRFVAFGDAGEGNEAQQSVANAAEVVCQDRGCDFALMLGDNFYDEGVTSVTDQQFIDKFETIYEGLDMPFYVVLGNHDYGSLASDWARGDYQVQYSETSDKWTMPHFWYTFDSDSGGTQFFAFDTQRMMFNHQVNDQREWFGQEMAASTATWKVAFAHHPYLSNGAHGNAGNYEGLPGLAIVSGVHVKAFIDDLVCGRAQLYLSGHDHNRQAFDPVCGTWFFVAGAAAKTSDFEFRDDNPTVWGDDQREGFIWVELVGENMTASFYDLDGNLDHETMASL
jgi:predicted MPP superfamily phosphohydrolase